MDTTIGHQPLQGKTGDFPAKGVEGGQYDGFRGIIHDQVHPGGGFDGPDISAFPADDLTL